MVVAVLSRVENFNPILRHRRKAECRNSLRMVKHAILASAIEHGWTTGKKLTDADIAESLKYINTTLANQCPSGGRYDIQFVGQNPICSHHGDLLGIYGEQSDANGSAHKP